MLALLLTIALSRALKSFEPFDPKLAHELYLYTKITVCNPQQIQDWECGFFCDKHPDMVQIKVFQNDTHSSLAYVGYNTEEKRLIVSFRSTQNINNFINDVKFLKVNYPCDGCQVHRGFYETYHDINTQILSYTKRLYKKYPNSKVTLVGHSLGAALATFTSLDLELLNIPVHTFYVFGSPRIGNKKFKEYFERIIVKANKARVTHHQDIVPHLPPMKLDYHHLVKEYWFDKDFQQFSVCDDSCEDPKCSNSMWATSLYDHQSYFGITYKCNDSTYIEITQNEIIL